MGVRHAIKLKFSLGRTCSNKVMAYHLLVTNYPQICSNILSRRETVVAY